MKKVLQKSCQRLVLLVVMLAMSITAMAQDATFFLSNMDWYNNYSINVSEGDVTVKGTAWSYVLNLYPGQDMTVTSKGNAIDKIVVTAGSKITNVTVTSGMFDVDTQTWNSQNNQTTSVVFSTTSDYYITKVEVFLKDSDGGNTEPEQPTPNGKVVTKFRDGYEYTLAAVGYNGTKYFWNVNAAGTNTELVNAATGQGTKYLCEVNGDKIALKAPNGKYLRVKQFQNVTWLQNFSLTGIDEYSDEYSLLDYETYSPYSYYTYSYLSGVAIQGKRGTENGANRTSYFTVAYSNNGSSGWGFNNNGGTVFNNTNSTLFELTEYEVEATETEYTIDITNAAGANVTICGEAVVGSTYTATKTLLNSDVVVTGAPAGYKAEVSIENETITITWVEMPKTTITDYSDAPGSYSLDVKTDGFNDFRIYFADNFAENYTYQNLPQLLNWTLPNGASAGGYPYANSGSNVLVVTLNDANVAGDYHLTIPAGVLNFVGGKTNPAIDLTWSLTAATTFSVGYYDYDATGEKSSEYAVKTLTGFDVAVSGVVFDRLSASDCIIEKMGTYDPNIDGYTYTPVDAAWSLNDNVVSIRFNEPYTTSGNYYFRVRQGAIVANDNRVNREFDLYATVDPNEYFNIEFGETEFEGAFDTFTLTLPEGITATSVGEFEASYWDNSAYRTQRFTVRDAEFTQDGRKLTVKFTAPAIPLDQNFSVVLEEGTVKTADANQISRRCAAYNLFVRPKRMHFVKMGLNDQTKYIEYGAKIEEASTLYVCFDEPIAEGDDQWLSATAVGATIIGPDGNDLGFTSGSFYCVNYGTNNNNAVLVAKLSQTVSALGVYTFRLPANVYTSTSGHKNEAVEFTFEIVAMPLEVTSVSINSTEGGIAMPIYAYFNQKIASAGDYDGKIVVQKKAESGYENISLDNYGWTNISDYSYSGWYGEVTYNNYATINLYDANGTNGSYYSLEAGDYRLVIDKEIFTSIKGTKLKEDYYHEFTVTAVPSAAVAGALDGKYYGTYYASRNWIVPTGVIAYYVDAVNNGEIHLVKLAEEGGVVNGNIGVLLESTEAIAKAPIVYTSQYGDSWANDNMLRGTTSDQLITNDSWGTQYKYYMLSRKDGVVGFYWDPSTSNEGASLNNKANKAYLRIPVDVEASSAIRIAVDESELTGIDSVAIEDANAEIFDLQGKRVVAPKAGVYVKNGKKYIVK